MATLKDMTYQTSVFTGTGKQEGAGSALARLFVGGAKAVSQYDVINKKLTEEQEAERKKAEGLWLSSLTTAHEQNRLEAGYDNMSKEDQIAMIDMQMKDFDELDLLDETRGIEREKFKNSYKSTITKKEIEIIEEVKTQQEGQFLNRLGAGVTLEGINKDIATLNDIGGKQITKDEYYKKMQDSVIEKLKHPQYATMTTDELRQQFPFMSEIKNTAFTDKFEAKLKTMEATRMSGLDAKVSDEILADYAQDVSSKNAERLLKKVLSLKAGEDITGTKQFELANKLRIALGKDAKADKSSINDYINLLKVKTNFDNKNTTYQDEEIMSFFNNKDGAIKMYEGIMNTIQNVYADDIPKMQLELEKTKKSFLQNLGIAIDVQAHQEGDSLQSFGLNSVTRKIIENRTEDNFYKYLSNVNVITKQPMPMYEDAGRAIATLGKLPENYKQSIISDIMSGDVNSLSVKLNHLNMLRTNHKAMIALNKDPLVSSLTKVVGNNENMVRIMPMLQALHSGDKAQTDRLDLLKKEISINQAKDKSWFDRPIEERNFIVDKLAYNSFFDLKSGKSIVEDADDAINETVTKVGNTTVFDPKNSYNEDELAALGYIIRDTNLVKEDDDVSIRVNDNGGISVSSRGVLFFSTNDKAHTEHYTNLLSKAWNEANPEGNLDKILGGLGLSISQLKEKSGITAESTVDFLSNTFSKMFKSETELLKGISDTIGLTSVYNKSVEIYKANREAAKNRNK